MKKIILVALMASKLLVADTGVYVGIDGGVTWAVSKTSIPSLNFNESEKSHGSAETFKVGYYLNKNNRINGFYHKINGTDANVYGAGYDYLFGDTSFKPFLGAIVGYSRFRDDGDNLTPATDIRGNIFGFQAGINYTINENISLEAGARYLKSFAIQTINDEGTDVTFKVDPMHNLFIGANYNF